jgi:ComF family protein
MLKKFINGLINLIYPARCIVCKRYILDKDKQKFICDLCQSTIKKNIPPFCKYCSRHIDDGSSICKECKDKTFYFDEAFSSCVYEDPLREIIHQFKYNGKDYLGRFLAGLLIEFINTYKLPMKDFDFIIPIPLYPSKLRQREYNQALILAEYIAKEFKLKLLKDALYKIRNTPAQAELDSQQRWKNISDCFRVNPKISLKDKNILLIDDILTTGATTSEAAKTLKSKGARKVTVLVLAS